MLVLRFKVTCQPGKADDLATAFADVVGPSRNLPGVVSFDVARDVTDANTFIATEVFEDADARARQEALPEVAAVMGLMPTALAGPPEVQLYNATL
jgi:quinol monooxygenase YgiN